MIVPQAIFSRAVSQGGRHIRAAAPLLLQCAQLQTPPAWLSNTGALRGHTKYSTSVRRLQLAASNPRDVQQSSQSSEQHFINRLETTIPLTLETALDSIKAYKESLAAKGLKSAEEDLKQQNVGRRVVALTWKHAGIRNTIEANEDQYEEYLAILSWLVVGAGQTSWFVKWLLMEDTYIGHDKLRYREDRWKGKLLASIMDTVIEWIPGHTLDRALTLWLQVHDECSEHSALTAGDMSQTRAQLPMLPGMLRLNDKLTKEAYPCADAQIFQRFAVAVRGFTDPVIKDIGYAVCAFP